MSAALPPLGPTRVAVAVTPINSTLFNGLIVQGIGDITSVRVEVDLATGTAYTALTNAGGFFPPGADTPSQFKSSMGWLINAFFLPGATNMELRIEQAVSQNAPAFNAWQTVWNCGCVFGQALPWCRIPIVSSLARISVINNSGANPTSSLLVVKAMTA